MLGKIGLQLFTFGLFTTIVIYHFFTSYWILSWVPIVCWTLLGSGFLLWFIFSIEVIVKWIQKRSSQFGISVIISVIAIIGLLGSANWIAIQKNCWPFMKDCKFDMTRGNIHSLSDQTVKILQNLKEEITVDVWTVNIKGMSGSHNMERFLDNYVQKSGRKLKLNVRNPNADKTEAIAAKVTRNDLIIVKSAAGRESRVENFNDSKAEEQITNAIVQVSKGKMKTLCFISGHGELPTVEAGGQGKDGMSVSNLKETLENSSYTVKEIMLATEKAVPADCESLVSIGPKTAPSDSEVSVIKTYLDQGGKLLALWGIETPGQWQNLVTPYGVKLDDNLLVDPKVQGAPGVFTKNYSSESEIVRNFNLPVLLVLTRSIDVGTSPAGVKVSSIVSTENGTLAAPGDLKALKSGKLNISNTKPAGSKPIVVEIKKTIAAATPESTDKNAENKEGEKTAAKESTVILMGNYLLASNGLASQYGNQDFLLNTVSYIMRDTDLIGIRSKDIKAAKLEVNQVNYLQAQGYLLLTTFAFIALAFATAFRRKISVAT